MYNGNGIWIPVEILHNNDLTSTEKILYAEIYYLDRPDTHCFASNEYLAQFLGISESGVKKCLSHLRQLGYIETVSFDGRTRAIATTVRWSNQTDTPVSSRSTQECTSEGYKNEFLLLKENKKENSIKAPVPGALAKHPRNFSNNTLTDDLQSGKDIDEQKKEKKKLSEYDKCYKEIDDRYTDKNINSLLHQHLDWSYYSKDPKRIRSLKIFQRRLDELDKLDNKEEVIKQSLQKQWHCFYEVQTSKSVSYSDHSDGIITQTLSSEEAKEVLRGYAERNGIV